MARKLNLRRLEAEVGVSKSSLSAIHNDRVSPELELIYELAELYGVAPEVLLRSAEPEGTSPIDIVAGRLGLSAQDAKVLARIVRRRHLEGPTVADITSIWLRYRYDLP